MDGSRTQLIEAAVRPLSDNAEMKLAAADLLDSMLTHAPVRAEETVSRWETMDRRNFRRWWTPTLLIVVLVVSGWILTRSTYFAININRAFGLLSGSVSTSGDAPTKAGRPDLTADEKLLLYGDESQPSKSGKAKTLWDRHPDNPVYFAKYTEAYLSENGRLSQDFLAEARRIDPSNAYFIYVAAGVEAKDSVKKKPRTAAAKATKEAPEWEILNRKRLDRSLELIREARTLTKCQDYKYEFMRSQIPLLAQETHVQWLISTGFMANMTTSDAISMRKLGEAISAKAGLLANENDVTGLRELMKDADALVLKTTDSKPSTLVSGLVYRVNITTAFQGLADAAKKLGLNDEAHRYRTVYDELTQLRESHSKRGLTVDGTEFQLKSSLIAGLTLPMVSRQVAHPPVITDSDVKPGRLMDHEILSMACAVAVFLLLGVCLALVWASRFRLGATVRRLTVRMESLLLPIDWLWIIGGGIVLPLLLVAALNRLTPLGGRDFSVFGMKFVLPLGHFFTLFLLWLIVPILVTRWRLTRRAACFGFSKRGSWTGWVAVLLVVAYSVGIGMAVPDSSMEMVAAVTALLLLPKLWLPTVAGRALLGNNRRLLISGTIARVLVPVYASAMLLMISLVPVFQAAEQYWFERNDLMKLDPEYPGMGSYEYKVAVQLQKEVREILGDGPLKK
jgi:hypothetical protein